MSGFRTFTVLQHWAEIRQGCIVILALKTQQFNLEGSSEKLIFEEILLSLGIDKSIKYSQCLKSELA